MRRRFLARALTTTLSLLLLWPALAQAAPVSDANHVLNRLGYGPRPGELARVEAMGAKRYIQQQLHPEAIEEPPALSQHLNSLETIHLSPRTLFMRYQQPLLKAKQQTKKGFTDANLAQYKRDVARIQLETMDARLSQAVYSNRQLEQVLTEFWFNHFNVYAQKGLTLVWIGAYEQQAIRPHVLGSFKDLLTATARHPAMLFYLDNWLNTAPGSPGARGRFKGLNENYARELLELHTLGVDGGYTQKDVIELARVLTGWGYLARGAQFVDGIEQATAFDASRHDTGTKVILGHTIQASGAAELDEALDLLASHPSTARHISRRLAQFFVADVPPAALVNRLTTRFQQTNGDIRAVLETLFESPEFWVEANRGNKFKSPYRYVVSTLRASDVPFRNTPLAVALLKQMGLMPYGWETPDGYPLAGSDWLNPDAMTLRLNYATALGGGYLPFDQDTASNIEGLKELRKLIIAGKRKPVMPAPSVDKLLQAVRLDDETLTKVKAAPAPLQPALILGSPAMMYH